MGNICCEATTSENLIDKEIPILSEYELCKMPHDQIVEEWKKDHQSEKIKNAVPMKHKHFDRFYYGAWLHEKPEGRGFIYEPHKLFFDGQFINGLPNGKAHIKFLDRACQFEGNLEGGKAHGFGTIDDAKEKYSFSGEWMKSRPKQGKLTLTADPNVASVESQDFEKGVAVISYKDNRKYEGQISVKKLLPHGKGKVTFPYGSPQSSYDGEWWNGQMYGKGTFIWSDGSSYEGQFIEGLKQGWGKFTFPSKNYYQGYWLNGKQNGVGTLFNQNGIELKKGTWENGVFKQKLSDEEWKSRNELQKSKQSQLRKSVESKLKSESPQQSYKSYEPSAHKSVERKL